MRLRDVVRAVAVLGVIAMGSCARVQSKPQAASAEARTEPRNEEECRACQGEWGRHGLANVESCICRTRDAGSPCRGGDECEGDCIASGEVQVTNPDPPRRGYFLGKCAERSPTFGCFARLPEGAAKKGPVSLEEEPPVICVD